MKAIAKVSRSVGLQLIDTPIPKVDSATVLVRPRLASICGSDLPIYAWNDPWTCAVVRPIQVIGHEFVGDVVETGREVSDIKVGDQVTAEGHLFCGTCAECRTDLRHMSQNQRLIGFSFPGAFADVISVPASNVIKVDNLDQEIACLLDPIGNAVHALSKVAIAGRHVLICGCGPLGLMTIALAKCLGPRTILAVDTVDYRLSLAHRLGASTHRYVDSDSLQAWVRDVIHPECGIDVLFEMSGAGDAIQAGCRALKSNAEAVFMGLPTGDVKFDFANLLVGKQLTITGVVGREIFRTWHTALSLLRGNPALVQDLKSIVTHRLPFMEYKTGFNLMLDRGCGKVILQVQT